jgi:hypothetical protein
MFTNELLAGFDGVMFVSNTEEGGAKPPKRPHNAKLLLVLDANGQAALKTFFQSGGAYTGVHSASACLYNDQTYLQAVGGESTFAHMLMESTL